MDGNAIEYIFNSVGIAIGEFNPGDHRCDFDPNGWHAEADDLPWPQEQLRRKLGGIEAKLLQRRDDPIRIGSLQRDPYVHIGGRPWVPMVTHSIAADQEVLNMVDVEQSQKLFEVGW